MSGRRRFRGAIGLVVLAGLLGFAARWHAAHCQEPGTLKPAPFMRAKLPPTKEILEGIALNDFDMIAKNAGAVRNLLLDEGWMVVQSEEYRRQTEDFRRIVDEIRQAAADKNIDRATLGYMQMTFQCVRCHKTLRGTEAKR